MSNSITSIDVRVNRDSRNSRISRAARSAASFLRRQAEMQSPVDKTELAAMIWKSYWKMHEAGMLAAPRTTRSILRDRYGFWASAGVQKAA